MSSLQAPPLTHVLIGSADYETTDLSRLRREARARMLGNGLCTRPAELDCRMESACETRPYFRTGIRQIPVEIPPCQIDRSGATYNWADTDCQSPAAIDYGT